MSPLRDIVMVAQTPPPAHGQAIMNQYLLEGSYRQIHLHHVRMAFSEEIFWAGITSIHKGQWEAARSTGLGFVQTLINVVLPQALRLTVAPLTNRTIAITKGTALGTVVALHEILGAASSAMSNSYNPSPLMMGAAAYLVLFIPVVIVARRIETKFAWKR